LSENDDNRQLALLENESFNTTIQALYVPERRTRISKDEKANVLVHDNHPM
jgi:hypothetical protein